MNSERTGGTSPRIPTSPSALLGLAGIGLMAGAMPAAAQDRTDEAGTDSSILVTGLRPAAETESDKRTAPLLDTPQTVSVIPQEVIRDRAARTLADVLRNTPGISFDAGENGFATSSNNFTLRGFDTSGSVFIDNARDSGSYSRDVFNVESVEVVKGAANTNGRGSAGGYVNINTKKPTLSSFVAGDISFGFDDYDGSKRKRASVDVNQALGGSMAIRLNAVVEDSGVPGRELAKNEFWGIAPSLAVGLGTGLRAILSWEHLERNDRPDYGVPGFTFAGKDDFSTSVHSQYDSAFADVPRDAFYGLSDDFDDATTDVVLGRFEIDLSPGVTLSNQTRWNRIDRSAGFSIFTASPLVAPDQVALQTQFYDRTNKNVSNLTNLSASFATGGISHSVALGVEYTNEKTAAGRFGNSALPATDAFDPDPARATIVVPAPSQTAHVDVETFGFYLYDTIEIAEQFQITGGVRGEEYKVEIESLDALTGAPAGGPGGLPGLDYSKFTWSWNVGAAYKPVPEGNIYASFGIATLPPGSMLSNPDISRTGGNAFPGFVPGTDPVRSHNYEVGVKWDLLGGALSATAAGFRTEKRNMPVSTANTLRGYYEQVVQGVELGLAGAITPEWNIYAGALFMDSKRNIDQALEDFVRAANSGDYTREDGTVFTSTDGERLAFSPNISANLWTTYRFPFGLTLGGGIQHAGSSFIGRPDDASRIIPNERYAKLDSYTLVNAMIAYEINPNIDIRLNVDNLFNEKYASTANWNARRVALGAPRTYLLSLGFQF